MRAGSLKSQIGRWLSCPISPPTLPLAEAQSGSFLKMTQYRHRQARAGYWGRSSRPKAWNPAGTHVARLDTGKFWPNPIEKRIPMPALGL